MIMGRLIVVIQVAVSFAILIALAGCQTASALEEATAEVRGWALQLDGDIAEAVDGIDEARVRDVVVATADSPGASRQVFQVVDGNDTGLLVDVSFRARAVTGGGWTYDDATVLLCGRYTVEADTRRTVTADVPCPADHVAGQFGDGGIPQPVTLE
jgi:hypothetical protein